MCLVSSLPKWSQPLRKAYSISNSAHLCVFGVKREKGVIWAKSPQFWENSKIIIFSLCAMSIRFQNGLNHLEMPIQSQIVLIYVYLGQKGKRGHLGPKSQILGKFQNYYFQLMHIVNALPKWSPSCSYLIFFRRYDFFQWKCVTPGISHLVPSFRMLFSVLLSKKHQFFTMFEIDYLEKYLFVFLVWAHFGIPLIRPFK